jgi:hypothetical protein
MRSQLADLYLDNRAMLESALPLEADGVSTAQLSAVARLTVALVDGYSIQLLIEPELPVGEHDTGLWETALKALLAPEITQPDLAGEPAVPGS